MPDGLLGGFDGALAGFSADQLDDLNAAAPDPGDAHPGNLGAAAPSAKASDAPVGRVLDPRDVPVGRVLDPRARAVAERLLGGFGGARRRADVRDDRAPRLVVLDGDAAPITLDRGVAVVIGRGGDSLDRLAVAPAVVSRNHCRVTVSEVGIVTIADLGSANGTVIVRQATCLAVGTEAVELRDGDVIATVGGTQPIARVEIAARPHDAVDDAA